MPPESKRSRPEGLPPLGLSLRLPEECNPDVKTSPTVQLPDDFWPIKKQSGVFMYAIWLAYVCCNAVIPYEVYGFEVYGTGKTISPADFLAEYTNAEILPMYRPGCTVYVKLLPGKDTFDIIDPLLEAMKVATGNVNILLHARKGVQVMLTWAKAFVDFRGVHGDVSLLNAIFTKELKATLIDFEQYFTAKFLVIASRKLPPHHFDMLLLHIISRRNNISFGEKKTSDFCINELMQYLSLVPDKSDDPTGTKLYATCELLGIFLDKYRVIHRLFSILLTISQTAEYAMRIAAGGTIDTGPLSKILLPSVFDIDDSRNLFEMFTKYIGNLVLVYQINPGLIDKRLCAGLGEDFSNKPFPYMLRYLTGITFEIVSPEDARKAFFLHRDKFAGTL